MNYNEDSYFELLMKNHVNLLNDIVDTYYDKYYSNQILTYFRIYFLYYLVTTYIYKPELNINKIKTVFFRWMKESLRNKNKKNIIKNFEQHYNYLFKIFFVEKNIYFHVYFNNLIKYFLPLPFELNIYSPIITYRANVNTFYKKNNSDYFDEPNKFDLNKEYFSNYNKNEIDIHIPIKYFNEHCFQNINIIYLVGKLNKLYICDSNKKVLYVRNIDISTNAEKFLEKFLKNKSFEEIFPLWEKSNEIITFDDVIYICVMKKFNMHDLFNVFGKYEINCNKYKYLFNNTQLSDMEIESDEFIKNPTFFYLIPSSKSKYFKQETKRNCVIFKIYKNINNLLDLTNSVISNNNFVNHMVKRDKENKKWISYDPMKTLNYYKNGTIPVKFDENFKCLTTTNSNIKNRTYCDILYYAGRRKLQEIIFKTRKYKYKKLYLNLEINMDYTPYEKFRLYHPKDVPIYATWDFDKYVLYILNCNGFFFVDYGDAIDGGELLLIEPTKYVHKVAKSERACYKKDAFTNIETNTNLIID